MKKAIITGANSFIGRRLCRKLAANDYHVYAIVRRNFSHKEIFDGINSITLIELDMAEYGMLKDRITEKCDLGVLLAWNGTRGVLRDNVHLQHENYNNSILGAENMIALGCETIVTAGSQAEYGINKSLEKITERTECKPNTEYGKAKLKLYQELDRFCENRKVRLIEPRYFSLYGPDDSEKTMIISMIRNMLSNRSCDLTECIQQWDFMFIDDAVDLLFELIETKEASGAFNFGSGVSKPLKEYVYEMYRLTRSSSKLHFGAVPYPVTGMVHTNPSIEKLKQYVKDIHVRSFAEGIQAVIKEQREVMCER